VNRSKETKIYTFTSRVSFKMYILRRERPKDKQKISSVSAKVVCRCNVYEKKILGDGYAQSAYSFHPDDSYMVKLSFIRIRVIVSVIMLANVVGSLAELSKNNSNNKKKKKNNNRYYNII
jgi:hypothetical protein